MNYSKYNYTKYAVTLFLIAIVSFSFAQDHTLDSLKFVLKNAKHDTTRCNILAVLVETAPDGEWEKYNQELLNLTESKLKTNTPKNPSYRVFQKHYGDALNNMGYLAQINGNIPEALDYYTKSLKIKEIAGNKKSMAAPLNNIGTIYMNQGNIPKALEYYTRSLKIKEEIGDKKGLATSFNNIGDIYKNQGDTSKALDYYNKSLKLEEGIDNKEGKAITMSNIGQLYEKRDISIALEYYTKSLKIREETGNKIGIAISLNNIGTIYGRQHNVDMALEYYMKSLTIQEEINDKKNMIMTLINIGDIQIKKKNYLKALEFANRSLQMSQEFGYPKEISMAAKQLNVIYKATGNFQKSLEYYELCMQMRDSINNQETRKASVKQQLKYEYEKKAAADSTSHAKETQIKNIELQKQQAEIKTKRYTQYSLFAGLALVIIFAGFMYNRFKITQKQKKVIENQKHIVEEAHQEITDSINYAERLQRSLMANHQLLDENLSNYFVYFKPKDVVSGDFYWATLLENNNFCLVAADSTGHGVPGAIMSMMNMNSLKESVKEGLSQPHHILNQTRHIVIETLANDGSLDGGKDGMDAALLVFNRQKNKLEFSLANNPLWLIRNGELTEYKADKMPIGRHDKQHIPFTKHELDLEKDDLIYIFTDGFADQFGGDKGKKFMYKPLKELLLSIHYKTMIEQKQLLDECLKNWKGNHEQVDDICIIGVRI